jgi:hypothetical protein
LSGGAVVVVIVVNTSGHKKLIEWILSDFSTFVCFSGYVSSYNIEGEQEKQFSSAHAAHAAHAVHASHHVQMKHSSSRDTFLRRWAIDETSDHVFQDNPMCCDGQLSQQLP